MVTPDKDYAQLVTPHIKMLKPAHTGGKWDEWGVKEVCLKYGFDEPEMMIDYLALVGDTADNVPGCPGVGPKTAAKLLEQYHDCENIIAHVHEMKGALKKKIEEHKKEIEFSKFLVTIKTDVPVDVQWPQLKHEQPDQELLVQIFEELEFKSLIKKMQQKNETLKNVAAQPTIFDQFVSNPQEEIVESKNEQLESRPYSYELVDNEEGVRKLCNYLLTCCKFAVDTETTSLDPTSAQLLGISFSTEPRRAWYVSVPRETSQARRWVALLRPALSHGNILKVGQNLKYDYIMLARYGARLQGPMFDTMLAHYLLQPEMRHNMDFLANTYLNYTPIPIEQLIGEKGKGQKNMADLEPSQVYKYACEDADVTLQLVDPLEKELSETDAMSVFEEIEMPLMPVLAQMEMNGVRIDAHALKDIERKFKKRLKTLQSDIFQLAGHEFSVNSPKQVGEVLFGELQLVEKPKRTKSGQFQTGEEILVSIAHKHPIVQKILDFRGLRKLLSTYVEALPKLVHEDTGCIHTSFNQAVTATGRLSSSNPNLQNIPVRGDDGKEIRKAFIPEDGSTFFSADYSQIELRIMAHISGDEHMIEAFNQGEDIHAATAARIFKKPISEVTRDERRKAKTANFGIIYGISAFGLAERMNVSRTEAKELIDTYFATYPKIKDFMARMIAEAKERGFIETLFGRRRYLADINSRNAVVRGYAERNAVNAPIQGTAADIIKMAMIKVQQRINREGLRTKMILQVHDELNFTVPNDELEQVKRLVREEMEGAFQMSVPLDVDCGEGNNWLEAH